ncbi:hypothetical protein ANN_06879 [Periplaneta americana]|uniref:Uncharacterized protein n=1 Tax=Periplaneta americana TaxID=6978 RepID=A0ABQ8THA4_PERAM|nr:hypothetical protein ANN_06879 [Periplaneta americana]
MTLFDGSLATSLFGKVRGLLFDVVGEKRVEWDDWPVLQMLILKFAPPQGFQFPCAPLQPRESFKYQLHPTKFQVQHKEQREQCNRSCHWFIGTSSDVPTVISESEIFAVWELNLRDPHYTLCNAVLRARNSWAMCGFQFTFRTNLLRHIRIQHVDQSVLFLIRSSTDDCGRQFKYLVNARTVRGNDSQNLPTYSRRDALHHHQSKSHRPLVDERASVIQPPRPSVIQRAPPRTSRPSPAPPVPIPGPPTAGPSRDEDGLVPAPEPSNANPRDEVGFVLTESAFKSRIRTYAATGALRPLIRPDSSNIGEVLGILKSHIIQKVEGALKAIPSIKFNIFVECEFENVKKERKAYNFKSKNDDVYRVSNLGPIVGNQITSIVREFDILAHFIDRDGDFVHMYENRRDLEDKYDWNIEFPVKIENIAKFEKRNKGTYQRIRHRRKYRRIPVEGAAERTGTASKEICRQFKSVRSIIPDEPWIEFKEVWRSQKLRFVIYCDFESVLQPVHGCENSPATSWT